MRISFSRTDGAKTCATPGFEDHAEKSAGSGTGERTKGWGGNGEREEREGLEQAVSTCERVISTSKDVYKLFGLSAEYTVPTAEKNGAEFLRALKVEILKSQLYNHST